MRSDRWSTAGSRVFCSEPRGLKTMTAKRRTAYCRREGGTPRKGQRTGALSVGHYAPNSPRFHEGRQHPHRPAARPTQEHHRHRAKPARRRNNRPASTTGPHRVRTVTPWPVRQVRSFYRTGRGARRRPVPAPPGWRGRANLVAAPGYRVARPVTCGGVPVSVRWCGMAHTHPLMYLDSYVTISVR